MYLTEAAENDELSEQAVVKELMKRTDTLIDGLCKLASPCETGSDPEKLVITLEEIRSRKMQPAMHKFLYNLALAEGLATA